MEHLGGVRFRSGTQEATGTLLRDPDGFLLASRDGLDGQTGRMASEEEVNPVFDPFDGRLSMEPYRWPLAGWPEPREGSFMYRVEVVPREADGLRSPWSRLAGGD